MENPYLLKDGETPNLQRLLSRFVDWQTWNDEQHREDRGTCQKELWYTHDCCDNHRAFSQEFWAFYAMFRKLWPHAGFRDDPKGTFSTSLLKYMVVQQKLTVDILKIEKHWGMYPGEWKLIIPLSAFGSPLSEKDSFEPRKKNAISRLRAPLTSNAMERIDRSVYEELIRDIERTKNLEDVRRRLSAVIVFSSAGVMSWQEIEDYLRRASDSTVKRVVYAVWSAFFI